MRNHAMEADSKGYSTGYDSKYDSKGYAPDYKSSAKSVAPQYYNTPQVMTTDEWFQMSTSEQTSPTPSPQHLRHPTTVDDSKAENPIMGSFFGDFLFILFTVFIYLTESNSLSKNRLSSSLQVV